MAEDKITLDAERMAQVLQAGRKPVPDAPALIVKGSGLIKIIEALKGGGQNGR
ncbi:hypothetical protein QNH39_18855 [Neobacillus novalis]|uniref:Uncharacterized protein n=1 Tax=Neobacillus novalis TaxID=220687 RepID=A0AA95MP37_9BACI|nr:hypothetical protein [Neobacillus novalis]WHY84696.1 hypothetical protein QNH39_18855 [Neobacillus novalis]